MPDAVHFARVDRPRLQELAQAVRQLDFSRAIFARRGQRRKNIGCEHITSNDRQVRWCFFFRGLFDQIPNLVNARTEICGRLDGDDAVARDVFTRDALDGEYRPLHTIEDVDQLLDRWRIGVDHIVAEQNGERLVADQFASHENGVAEP